MRLIAGQHGGRRLRFPDAGGVRPTPDRVRETLFNWLAPTLVGESALDLFAGSGALGLEALSRGAARVDFVERDRRLVAALKQNLNLLGAEDKASVHGMEVEKYLGSPLPDSPYGLVFLDPPYDAGLYGPVLEALQAGAWLKPGAQIYLEYRSHNPPPEIPPAWIWTRQSTAGDVTYGLITTS
nr:16S rRNA (guanine(966)-N(2))-methyltransferase RsmD [Natronospira proteinivora]